MSEEAFPTFDFLEAERVNNVVTEDFPVQPREGMAIKVSLQNANWVLYAVPFFRPEPTGKTYPSFNKFFTGCSSCDGARAWE